MADSFDLISDLLDAMDFCIVTNCFAHQKLQNSTKMLNFLWSPLMKWSYKEKESIDNNDSDLLNKTELGRTESTDMH